MKFSFAISYEKLGELHQTLGNLDKALDFFEKQTQLGEELFRDYPNQVGFKNGLAVSYFKLGLYYEEVADKEMSKFYFLKCETLWQELVNEYPKYVEFSRNLSILREKL